jgi:hypothetical protein
VLCHSSGGNKHSHKVTDSSLNIWFCVCSLNLGVYSYTSGMLQPSQLLVKYKWLGKDLMKVEEDNVVIVHSMKTYRGSRGVAPLIHNDPRRRGCSAACPVTLLLGRNPQLPF